MRKFRKAYIAAGATFATALGYGLSDGALTGKEFCAALGVGLLAGAGVYTVKNEGA